jgi:U3 small nucleolar RNA-associated protein 21
LSGAKVGDDAVVRELGESSILSEKRQDEFDQATGLQLKPNANNVSFESTFTRLLRESSDSGNYTEFLKFLSSASPSVTDLEIKSINTTELTELSNLIKALTEGYQSNQDIELIEAWMNMLMKNHGDVILAGKTDAVLNEALEKWYLAHENKTQKFDDLVKFCSGVINLLTSV